MTVDVGAALVAAPTEFIMPTESIKEILERIQTLPPLPAAAQKIVAMADNPKTDTEDLGKVIAMDAALTGRILRVSNSAFYGLSRHISTITQAILIIGFDGVRNLALGVSVFKVTSKNKANRSMPLYHENFWRHSLAVATCARLLAIRFRLRIPEEAFVAGLLHDIGKVIFMEHFSEKYAGIVHEANKEGKQLNILEKETFGMDHTEIGEKICLHWKMPSNLVSAVSDHHIPSKEDLISDEKDGILQAVRVSDKLARIAQIGFDGNSNVSGDFLSILEKNGLSSEYLCQILLSLPEEVRKVEVFFDLHSSDETTKEHNLKKRLADVLLKDKPDRALVELLLLSMGVTLISIEQIEERDLHLLGVIVDDAVDPRLREKLKRKKVRLLDFSVWKKENKISNGAINIPRLQELLTEKLS